jgi:hypothetical protein
LTLSVALAGSVAAMLPPSAQAGTECGSVSAAGSFADCSISGGYLQEVLDFKGSKGVKTYYDNQSSYFAACSSHLDGKNSFGMTTQSTQMFTRDTTGKNTDAASGCAT